MAFILDIAATYRGPGRVIDRFLAAPEHEGRVLAMAIGACAFLFVAQWPALARKAHLEQQELNMLLGSSLMAAMFILPLLLYVLAYLAYFVQRLFGGKGNGYGARLALFWALLAASPLALLNGLVAGFIGNGAGVQVVGFLWTCVFLWFWLAGMARVVQGQA